jgi:hypothetical protein
LNDLEASLSAKPASGQTSDQIAVLKVQLNELEAVVIEQLGQGLAKSQTFGKASSHDD